MAERADRPGCYSAFRAPSLRAVDHRWVRAHEIYRANKAEHGSVSQLGRREIWDRDPVVTRLVRAKILTSGGSVAVTPEQVRPSDFNTMAAVDICAAPELTKNFHIAQCMFLGGADDAAIAKVLLLSDPDVVSIIHDGFYDVRERMKSPLLITSIVFPTCFAQGGVQNPLDVARIVAWAFGYEAYERFATSQRAVNEDMTAAFVSVLRRNQEVAGVLRRNLGFESIEAIASNLHDRVMIALKTAPPEVDNSTMKRLNAGLAKLGRAAGGPQVADDDVLPAPRVERPAVLDKLQPAQKEPHHAPA